MEKRHSIRLLNDKCIGCMKCVRVCTTEAIRVQDRKATIKEVKCIDCGACVEACQMKAITTTSLPINIDKDFFNIALFPIAFYGQFNSITELKRAFAAIKRIGFDYVFDTAEIIDALVEEMKKYIALNKDKPLISSYCPSAIRFIQLKYPSLVSKIIPYKTPQQIAAQKAIEIFSKKTDKPIKITYLTECPAHLTNSLKPIGQDKSYIDEIITLKDLYPIFASNYKKVSDEEIKVIKISHGKGMLWTVIRGQIKTLGVKDGIAVDGINNAKDVLCLMEMGKFENMSFVEVSACVGGCAGGYFALENPYIARSYNYHLYKKNYDNRYYQTFKKNSSKYLENINIELDEKIVPYNISKLDKNFLSSLSKLSKINETYDKLPKIDCCGCGVPSCRVMAEDIANGIKTLEDCIVLHGINEVRK